MAVCLYHMRRQTRRLYTSHFLSTWNSRIFEFAALLFLATVFPNSLREMSVYALVRACSAILLAPAIGYYIDSGNRLRVLTVSIGMHGFSTPTPIIRRLTYICISSRLLLLSVLILLACAEKLCSIMNTVSMERDWVVVIAEADMLRLQTLNARMRQIDLSSKLIGPLVISIVDGTSTILAIWLVLILTLVSFPVEYLAIAKVYKVIPALHKHGGFPARPLSPSAPVMIGSAPPARGFGAYRRLLFEASLGYIQHSIFMSSLAISILYLTVLNFSGQMVAYLLSIGYTSTQIGLLRTVSVAFEISATWLAPLAMGKVGPTRAGLWFINWQMACIAVAASFSWGTYWHSTDVAAWGFIAGVILSRTGLWGFDLCAQVLVQEEVEPTFRGSFSSVEASLQNFFELCSYALTMVYARPSQFGNPILCTMASAFVAGGLYARFVRKRRGHLFHVPCCVKPRTEN
ncbi:Ferroporti-1 [Terfezia claveryi]|nr:Ferroporti-1 [Terfezia claveryi]